MIKRINNKLVDVFFGTGWNDWVRMERVGNQWAFARGDANLAKGAAILLQRRFK